MEDSPLLESSVDHAESKPALVFNADTITLSGTFTDQLSAYRTRRQWDGLLSKHFLLEKEKDYDMKVLPDEHSALHFVLCCTFHSACGRYAFWRLVNHQAPDVETKLLSANMVSQKAARFLLGSLWNNSPSSAWIYSSEASLEQAHRDTESTKGVLQSLLSFFQKRP